MQNHESIGEFAHSLLGKGGQTGRIGKVGPKVPIDFFCMIQGKPQVDFETKPYSARMRCSIETKRIHGKDIGG